jgi:type I restriction enzyme M protein
LDQRPRVLLLPGQRTKFDVKFIPIGDWPLADESIGTARLPRTPSFAALTQRCCAQPSAAVTTFIHGNEGMAKDAAFWQFLY